jgi:cytochrome c oxidase cbb3-type subunit 3
MKASLVALLLLPVVIMAQTPPAPQQPPRAAPAPPGGGNPYASAYPQHPPGDPAAIERGKTLWGVHCSFCHGPDARGGQGGPSLIRSDLVLRDKNGELIAPVVQNGRPEGGMPKIDLTAAQVSDVAAYIHSFRVSGYDASRVTPPSILVGDAKAGEVYFNAKCAACHSVTGDLKGFGAKIDDPKLLQQTWLMPGSGMRRPFAGGPFQVTSGPTTTVTVTLSSGQKIEGRLIRIDDFIVVLVEADGTQRSFRRDGDVPRVEIHDPLKPHKDLLRTYTDGDIHNVTAYLVTLK